MFASTITLTLIGGPTVLIEFEEFPTLTDPTFDPLGHYQGRYSPVKFVKTTGPPSSPTRSAESTPCCNDGPVRTYKAGQSFSELPGDRHAVSAHSSETKPAKLFAVFVVDTNETKLTIPFTNLLS